MTSRKKRVDFKVAKFLYLLGYRENALEYYDIYGNLHYFLTSSSYSSDKPEEYYQAPDVIDAVSWLWQKGYRVWYECSEGKCCPVITMNQHIYKMKSVDTPINALTQALSFLASVKSTNKK